MNRAAVLSLATTLVVSLACGGLPTTGMPVPAPVVPAPPPVAPAPPPPAPATPESLFAALDANEAPPHDKPDLACGASRMDVRNPRGGSLRVFCVFANNGTKDGPYTEWAGKTLKVASTYKDGKLEGRQTRWEPKDGAARKVEEQVFAAGDAEGDFAQWDVDGNLLVRGVYVAGKREGRFLENSVADGAVTFGGACYGADAEAWRTTDPVEFVTKPCP